MPITSAERAAIGLRVNAIIMRAQMGDDAAVERNWRALLEFLESH